MQKLDPVPAFVHEHVDITVHQIATDLVPHQAAQRMEALPFVRRLALQPVTETPLQDRQGWMTL